MPSDSKNLKAEQKHIALAALVATPTKQKTITDMYNELNTGTQNTTEDIKQTINRTNIG